MKCLGIAGDKTEPACGVSCIIDACCLHCQMSSHIKTFSFMLYWDLRSTVIHSLLLICWTLKDRYHSNPTTFQQRLAPGLSQHHLPESEHSHTSHTRNWGRRKHWSTETSDKFPLHGSLHCCCTKPYESKQEALLFVDIHSALTLATARFQESHMDLINIPSALFLSSSLPLSFPTLFCLLRRPKRKTDSVGSGPCIPWDVSKPFSEEHRRPT